MEVINEPLVKAVPRGTQPTPYTPFFGKESDFVETLAQGHNLNDRFGLPIASESAVYDVYRITPKGPTEVFISEIAPTSELGGQVRHAGGAPQYLVPNRGLFTDAERVTSLGNDLALHHELVAGKGLGAPIAAAEAARGIRPGAGAAAKGLGALGVAATAYDIADTAHDVNRLHSQGNATAAEDRITRFAAQNLGGWGGAAAGMGLGAAAGVETGPGLLVTGAVGGIVGAVAGDKAADWIRDAKINHQPDRQGNTWTFDPDAPARGWTRRELDLDAMRYSQGAPVYRPDELRADAALADELTWKASSRSIELALAASPQNRDPYRLPPSAAEQAQRTPFEQRRALVRDPQSGQWQQDITELHDGRLALTRHVAVGPERAAELEQQSQAVIASNATRTPAAMAAQFQAAYEHNGWSQYGPMPEAVGDALRHPGRVIGSDGDRYERDAQGQWTHDGTLWDSRADGPLLQELEATYQAQQRTAAPVITLDPVVVRPDPNSAPAPEPGQPAAAAPPGAARHPGDPDHPDHALLERLHECVRGLDRQAGKAWDEHSERLGASALVMAKRMGFTERDALHLAFNLPTDKYAAGELLHLARTGPGASPDPGANRIHMPTAEALSTPVEDRYQQVQAIVQQQELERQQAQARGADDPSRSGPAR